MALSVEQLIGPGLHQRTQLSDEALSVAHLPHNLVVRLNRTELAPRRPGTGRLQPQGCAPCNNSCSVTLKYGSQPAVRMSAIRV